MKKLKIAIGIDGKGVFLERLPDDEEHAGLQDLFDFLKDDLYDFVEKPGIYLATLQMTSPLPRYNDPYPDPYLEITELKLVSEA